MRISPSGLPKSVSLSNYNAEKAPGGVARDGDGIDFLLVKGDSEIVGGIVAAIYWNLLEIKVLWVDQALRGMGHGSTLLEEAEKAAKARNCRTAVVDTFNFQSPRFYTNHGYRVFGVLHDCPMGHCRYYLSKSLV